MTLVWLVMLVSCVQSIWGFLVGVLLLFLGILSGAEEAPILAVILFVTGCILVTVSVVS